MKKSIAIDIISYAFILLFTYTALSKLFLYNIYVYDLGRSPLIGGFAPVLSIALPAAELIISAMLFFPKTRTWGLYGSLVLMSVFTFYVAYILKYETNLPCTCGGLIRELSWRQHLIFNIFFTCLAILGIWLQQRNNHIERNTTDLRFN